MRGDTEVTNSADVIDSRDVIQRIEYLTGERDSWPVDLDPESRADGSEDTAGEPSDEARAAEWAKDNPDDAAELAALEALQEEAEGYANGDWRHGETLIRETHFKEYAQDLAEELGAINSDASWPYTCIDWEKAADELRQDYCTVDFDGVTYLMRA